MILLRNCNARGKIMYFFLSFFNFRWTFIATIIIALLVGLVVGIALYLKGEFYNQHQQQYNNALLLFKLVRFFLGKRERGIQKQEKDLEEQKNLMDNALENKNKKGFSILLLFLILSLYKKKLLICIFVLKVNLTLKYISKK